MLPVHAIPTVVYRQCASERVELELHHPAMVSNIALSETLAGSSLQSVTGTACHCFCDLSLFWMCLPGLALFVIVYASRLPKCGLFAAFLPLLLLQVRVDCRSHARLQ